MKSLFRNIVASLTIILCVAISSVRAELPPWTRFKLSNGLEVLVVENHLTPIVTIEIAVRNGSFTEPPDYNGLSHLYEHMFFTSNAKDTTTDAFLSRVDDLGIVFNGRTREELVYYYFTLPQQNLVEGMDFMSRAISSPLFKEDDLRKQREIVLGEFDRDEAQPLFKFNCKMDAALWGAWLSRKEPLGDRAIIRTATHEKMLAIKNKYYLPNNSLLIVSGDVDTRMIKELAPRCFQDWKAGPDPFKTTPPVRVPQLTRSSLVLDTLDIPQVVCNVKWHGPSIGLDDKSTYVADVFSYIVTQPDHEFSKCLRESGIAQEAGLGYYTQRYVGPITAQIVTSPDRLDSAMHLFWSQVAKFDDPNYFSDEEFETAKGAVRNYVLFESEKLSNFTHEIAFWWSTAGLDYYEHYLDDLSKITKADVAEYIHKYIQGKPYVLGLALSKSAAIVTEPSLAKYGNPNMPWR